MQWEWSTMENKNKTQQIRGLGKHNESSMECKRMSKPFKREEKVKLKMTHLWKAGD